MFNIAEGSPDVILTGKNGFLSLQAAARREGLLDTTRDQFDRQVMTFNGIPVVHVGTKGDQSTQIITNTENFTGSPITGGTATSFYLVRWGEPYTTGIQMNAPERIFDGILDDGVTHRVVFEWPVGLAFFHKRSVVRISGVTPF